MAKQNPDQTQLEFGQSVLDAIYELGRKRFEQDHKNIYKLFDSTPVSLYKTISESKDAALSNILDINNFIDAVSYSESISIRAKLHKVKTIIKDKPLPSEGKLYYYTDFDTFINKIVEEGNNKSKRLSLLAGHCEYMNDKAEFQLGYDLLCNNENIQESTKHTISQRRDSTPFIIAFSLAKDSLPMWNLYGNRAGGVMLAFDFAYLDKTYNGNIKSCIYNDSDAYKILLDFLLNTKKYESENPSSKNISIFNEAVALFPFLVKNKAFSYEQEVRIFNIPWPEDRTEPQIFIRRHNLLCPYTKIFFPSEALCEIWLSPREDFALTQQSMRWFLQQHDLSHVEIKQSEIPYRG